MEVSRVGFKNPKCMGFKLKNFGHKMKNYSQQNLYITCCSVEFVDEQIFNDLGKYDIVPNKTYVIKHIPIDKVPEKYLSAFALGLFDGDGSLSMSADCSTDVTLGYTAYHETEVEDFQKLINKLAKIEKRIKTSLLLLGTLNGEAVYKF